MWSHGRVLCPKAGKGAPVSSFLRVYLGHIRDAINDIRSYAAVGEAAFLVDRMRQDAVISSPLKRAYHLRRDKNRRTVPSKPRQLHLPRTTAIDAGLDTAQSKFVLSRFGPRVDPADWRYVGDCHELEKQRKDDSAALSWSVLTRCKHALQARDLIAEAFYAPHGDQARGDTEYHFDYLTLFLFLHVFQHFVRGHGRIVFAAALVRPLFKSATPFGARIAIYHLSGFVDGLQLTSKEAGFQRAFSIPTFIYWLCSGTL
ncbi:MAG: hypothetical protein K2Y23_24645 [Cyanobacteria bacterium]|nr:hypothetical protein [Cyanobacteriota bacterium]